MANQGGGSSLLRDYRKGNWTVQETMVLIEAKKMDDERRMKRVEESEGRSKPAELRWKWVEDYCWRNGCLRSQNQCNDKWDNLMRDFKKVRDYERRLAEKGGGDGGGGGGGGSDGSYWKIEKHERKERNLPSNMLPQIYEALVEVVERKGGVRVVVGGGSSSGGGGSNVGHTGYVVERSTSNVVVQQPSFPPLQHSTSAPPQAVLSLPPPPPRPPPPPPAAATQPDSLPQSQPLPTVDSDTSEHSDSPAKRRRRGKGRGEGTSGTASGRPSNIEVGTAISESASLIAEAIQACEEREETRHRELLNLYQRRLEVEESKTEITRQGINGLVDAINKLANSILSLAKQKN